MEVGSNSKTSILTDLSVFINSATGFTPSNAGKTRYSLRKPTLKTDTIPINSPLKSGYNLNLVCQRKFSVPLEGIYGAIADSISESSSPACNDSPINPSRIKLAPSTDHVRPREAPAVKTHKLGVCGI